MEKTVTEAIHYRRSVRVFEPDENLDYEKVRTCLENAHLAPTSSNLQLWEFYHIEDPVLLKQLSTACLDQNAAKTAKQMVVVVVRKDLWRKRAQANIGFLEAQYGHKEEADFSKREKFALNYYRKLIPTLYTDFLGILGRSKQLVFGIMGLFKPMYRQVTRSDMRIVAHKSAGLAAQNFMLSMAAIGYDTCPMEGSDTKRVKRILDIPAKAEINMVIGCGVRSEQGIYGPRFRVPFNEVYKHL